MNRNKKRHNKSDYLKIVEILNIVANDIIEAQEALQVWPVNIDYEDDLLIQDAWHSLIHYKADADIRMKDEEYTKYQKEELLKFAVDIRKKYL